jgi:multidrug resistance efflux pump
MSTRYEQQLALKALDTERAKLRWGHGVGAGILPTGVRGAQSRTNAAWAEGVADAKEFIEATSDYIEQQRLTKQDGAAQQERQQDCEALDAARAQLGKDAATAMRQQHAREALLAEGRRLPTSYGTMSRRLA